MTNENVNVPNLRKAVEWAEAEAARGPRSEWMQEVFTLPYTEVQKEIASRIADEENKTEHYSELKWSARYHEILDSGQVGECGSAYCIAGYAVHVLGGIPVDDRVSVAYETEANKIFGLDESFVRGVGYLYGGGNSIEQVREIAEALAGEKL